MGWCCYLMGPLMMIVAVLLTMDRTAITPGLKSASVVLMVLLLCGITHIIGGSAAEGTFAESIKALYRGGTALTGGGACAILFGVYRALAGPARGPHRGYPPVLCVLYDLHRHHPHWSV